MKNLLRKWIGLPTASRIAVGSDIVWVPDVRASMQRFGERYLNFIFTPDEISYCRKISDEAGCSGFAARFAAKEATMKLLRASNDELLPWRSIEVKRTSRGGTELALYAEAATLAKTAGIEQLTLSLSHDRDYATAVVVAMCRA